MYRVARVCVRERVLVRVSLFVSEREIVGVCECACVGVFACKCVCVFMCMCGCVKTHQNTKKKKCRFSSHHFSGKLM